MKTPSKSNIAAILPLSEMQEALLLHHLAAAEDEGFMIVEFRIKGQLQTDIFKKAWDRLMLQYDVLRTTVHWEKMKSPVQVVHKELESTWQIKDLSPIPAKEQEGQILELRKRLRNEGLDLGRNPLLQFHLVRLNDTTHQFLWPSHHILLDGWSTSIIVRELMDTYEDILNGGWRSAPRAVPSLRAYMKWKNNRDKAATETFWKTYLEDLGKSPLFASTVAKTQAAKEIRKELILEEEETSRLSAYASDLRISLNSLVQSLWGLLVIAYGRQQDVVIGATVSGRSNDFPKMDELPGMFTRVQPVRFKVSPQCVLRDWLKANQQNLLGVLEHEHTELKDIDSFCNWELPSPMFDSIVIFENHPWSDVKGKTIAFEGFRGGMTTTYPVSLVVIPGARLRFNFIFKEGIIRDETMDWILKSWQELIRYVLDSDIELANVLVTKLSDEELNTDIGIMREIGKPSEIVRPNNQMEKRLHAIWQRLLPGHEISTNANFFEIGGSSLMAIRMFAILEKELGLRESPTKLLLYPTIQALALQLQGEKEKWEYLVPLKKDGAKTPVFCIHGGEGHVLFYQPLPQYLDPDRPVYLVQPKGIDGDSPMHSSIREMSTDYLSEIQKVQAKGPYNIVFFCYSALAVEFAKILEAKGEKANLIIIDSAAKEYGIKPRVGNQGRLSGYLRRLRRYPMLTVRSSIKYRYRKLVEPLLLKLFANQEKIRLRKVRDQLHQNHAKYQWERFNTPCTLILLQNEHPELRDRKIRLWSYWSQNEVDVHFTPGNHLSVFEEPHVQSLGPIIESACN